MALPSGPMGGSGVGSLPHEGHPAKDPLADGVLIIDHIHKGRLTSLQQHMLHISFLFHSK